MFVDTEAVAWRFSVKKVFSCEFSEISKNTFFVEHLWVTASMDKRKGFQLCDNQNSNTF